MSEETAPAVEPTPDELIAGTQWDRIEMRPTWRVTGPGFWEFELAAASVHLTFIGPEARGEGTAEIDESPLPAWSDVAQTFRDQYRLPVHVFLPEGHDPAVVAFSLRLRRREGSHAAHGPGPELVAPVARNAR